MKALIKLAKVYQLLNTIKQPLEFLDQAMEIAKKVNGTEECMDVARLYKYYGYVQTKFYFWDEGVRYLEKSKELYMKLQGGTEEIEWVADVYKHLGELYTEKRDYDKAEECF